MSNHRAIATVTAVIAEMIGDAIKDTVAAAQVTTMRPGKAVVGAAVGVNVYLYRTVANAGLRNLADPIRGADGRLLRRPIAAWDLHYLITCIGDEERLEPEVLLGAVLTALNGQPTLPRGLIELVDAALVDDDARKHAAGSGLDEQVEQVRLTPIDLSLDAMVQLWGSLSNEPYALSVAFQAAVVLMSPQVPVSSSLPVGGAPSLSVATLRLPTITAVRERDDARAPILIGGALRIDGERLNGEHTLLRLGALEIDVDPGLEGTVLRADRIEVPLSPDAGDGPIPRPLAPGALTVQVCHLVDVSTAGDGSALRPGASSNVLACVLRPTITAAPTVTTATVAGVEVPAIEVPIRPAPDPRWDYALLLNEFGVGAPRSLTAPRWVIDEGGPEPRLLFVSDAVPAGEWLVRVQVNGADSPLTMSDGIYSGPRVTVAP